MKTELIFILKYSLQYVTPEISDQILVHINNIKQIEKIMADDSFSDGECLDIIIEAFGLEIKKERNK